jgi:hypothetical protein
MGIQDLIDNVLKAARVATKIIPGTADDAIVGVASKLNDIIGPNIVSPGQSYPGRNAEDP